MIYVKDNLMSFNKTKEVFVPKAEICSERSSISDY